MIKALAVGKVLVPGAKSGKENPLFTTVQRQLLAATHARRSRQLPTISYHASLPELWAAREYQADTPSRLTSLLESGLLRAGP